MVTIQDALEVAVQHLRLGQFERAAALGARISALYPELPDPWRIRGVALRHTGAVSAGLRLLGWALRLDPDLPNGNLNLENAIAQAASEAIEHLQAGRFAEAARLYRSVACVAPCNDNAHRNLHMVARLALAHARALVDGGEAAQALNVLEAVLESIPDNQEMLLLAGSLARQVGRMERARHILQHAILWLPACSPAFSELAQVLVQFGRWRDGAQLEKRAFRLDPANAESCLRRGISWKAAGCLEDALVAFAAASQLKPDDPVVLFNLGLVTAELGRWERAAAIFRRFLSVCPESSAGSLPALYAEQVVEQQPFQAAVRVRQGRCHREKGRAVEALEEFRAALVFDGRNAEAYRGLVWALWALGRDEEAAHIRRQGLTLYPNDPELQNEATDVSRPVVPAVPARQPSLCAESSRRPHWAIVPGLMRDIPAFTAILRHLLDLRARGLLDGIIVSTWVGQVSANPMLRRALDQHGVIVTESVEPRENPSGHILHQMKAVLAALDLCPDNSFVVKLRTDKLDVSSSSVSDPLETMLCGAQDLSIQTGDGWPHIFEQRVSVSGGMLHRLFNHADQIFGGLRSDLVKLVNFDFRYVEIFRYLRPEQWWFSYPFIDLMPVFQDYFRGNKQRPFDRLEARAFLSEALENDFFLEALVSYIVVMQKYYRVGWLSSDSPLYEMAPDVLRDMTYRDWFFKALHPFGGHAFQGIVATPSFYNDAWIEPLLNGALRLDSLGERILATYGRVRDFSYHRTYRRHAEARRPTLDAYALIP